MNAHLIIDPFRPHTNTTIEKEIVDQEIDMIMWPAIHDPNDVVRSINQSHKTIVAFAKEQKLPEICIMEEDVMFLGPGAWQQYLASKPEKFDLYLGGCYGLNQDAYRRIAEGAGAVQINNFAGLHCYIINESYYDRFLGMPENKHIDDQPGMGVFYVSAPFVALQHPGWSSNNKVTVNYNKNIPKECLYGQG